MKDFTRIFGFFFNNYRIETVIAVSLIILAGFAEAVGVTAFLPFFQLVLDGHASIDHVPNSAIHDFIANSGVQINLVSVGLFIAGAICLKALVLWLALRKVGKTVAKIAADLRRRLLNALLNARWGFFVNHTLGVSLNAVVMETFNSSMAFVSLARFLSALVQFSIYAIGALLLSWKMFVGAIVIGVALACALWNLVHIARRAGIMQIELSKKMLSQMADMLQGIKPLRAMSLEDKFMGILTRHSLGLEKSQADQLISSQSMRVFHEPLMVITAILGMYGAITYGGLSTSELALISIIFIRLLNSMNVAQGEYQRLMTQEAALWSLMKTIKDTEDSAENWEGNDKPPKEIESLIFENVYFEYGDKPVLSGVNIEFKPKSLTALVGSSGSGKTTILDLLSGFYTVSKGSVMVNGSCLLDFDIKAWRGVVGFVPQEVFLFNDTVIENILMGRSGYGEGDVWRALEQAGAREFVESLPDKLYSSVGEGGRMLSGGQRQRIAIARAIVHKPQILLLDEATSALDAYTEKYLLDTLKELSKEITVIFISHNETVQDFADRVYYLENGEAVVVNKG